MTHPLEELIETLERNRALAEPEHLARRAAMLDRLETYLPQGSPVPMGLRDRARVVRERLEAVDAALYRSLREAVRRGEGARALQAWMPAAGGPGVAPGDDYDHLDELLGGVLALRAPRREAAAPAAEMVFYQPTPARHAFDLILRTAPAPDDVLVDLGSGLGHVPLLAAICTPARCVGIEVEPAYVDCARRCARALGLETVRFEQQDAREADLQEGTIFYLYTPFSGSILRTVLDSLRRQATRRAIRVCTFGPCTLTLAAEPWLTAESEPGTDHVAVFHAGP